MSEERTPSVSVIMPSYCVSQYIGEAIESVLAQSFQDYEIIVVNDGSPDTDELERVLAPYADRIVYVKQENGGCSAARNTAIRVSRGRYLALLDPDDVWEKDYLEVQIGMLERDPSIDLLYPNATIFGDMPDSGRLFMDLSPSEGEVTFESLVSQRCNVMISVTARREAIVGAGMFDESLRSAEDFDMWLRMAHGGARIVYHRRPLVRYRRRRGSLSSNPAWMCRNVLRVFQKAEETLDLSEREREALKRQCLHFRALRDLYQGKQAFFQGEVSSAIENLTRANEFFKSGKLRLTCLALRVWPRLLLRAYDIRDRFIIGANTKY
ncbi:MAG TPA: glycosyltransferase family A protein [Blastocatellia bacterium]|jgi:glycosyltransferase involved in cell wall biosynthesis|nr:glycosyltransferase family A protein [Blastocatellia bacterium]